MTINAPAALLLLLYQLVAEEQGVSADKLTGTIQNDVLKEYIARGTYIYPPAQSLRLITNIFEYCRTEIPKWNTISISGYHMAEAGASPTQEIAFTLADGIEYVRAAVESGQEAIRLLPELRPDLVLLDLQMPGMDGIQTTRIIRRREPGTVVIVISADLDGRSDAAREAGEIRFGCRLVARGVPTSLGAP